MSNGKKYVSDEITITHEEMKPDSYNIIPPECEEEEKKCQDKNCSYLQKLILIHQSWII